MNPARLWRGNRGGTLGGVVAVNAAGPRRIKAGAARDHVLGFRAVSGRGELFKSGGQVMKNVTGYDLSKLMAGSYGTLAVLTDITIKVLPRGRDRAHRPACSVSTRGKPARRCARPPASPTRCRATPACRTGAGPISRPARAWRCGSRGRPSRSTSVLRTSSRISVHAARSTISARRPRGGLWAALRDAEPVADVEGPVWKISTAPSQGASFVAALRAADVPLTRWYYDWAGGLIWLALEGDDAHAGHIRDTFSPATAATPRSCAPTGRSALRSPVFQPQPGPLAALSRRVKAGFDPMDILNRGRLGSGGVRGLAREREDRITYSPRGIRGAEP